MDQPTGLWGYFLKDILDWADAALQAARQTNEVDRADTVQKRSHR